MHGPWRTNGKGTGLVGYNVQAAVDTKHHLVVAHEVTNVGHDRTQLATIAGQAQAASGEEAIQVLADRGYFSGEEILACDRAGIAVTLPKPMTSGAKAEGRFGKQDFVYQASDDTYRCPGDQTLTYRFESIENGMTLRRYLDVGLFELPDQDLLHARRAASHHALGTRARAGSRPAPARREPERDA